MIKQFNHLRACVLVLILVSTGLQSEPVAEEVYARTMFRRSNFLGAISALGLKPLSLEGQWIVAESFFRLAKFDEAKSHFEAILDQTKDPVELRKLRIRLFDCALLSGNLAQAIADYESFKKIYRNAPAIMSYGLAKALFDADYDKRAISLLASIAKDSEFFMRSRYLLAVMKLDTHSAKLALKSFNQIEKMKALSVEDYSVRELAILAQIRLYIDMDREDLARAAYERILLSGPYGERATIELLRFFIMKAEQATYKEGSYARSSDYSRELAERAAINKALVVIERYRAVKEIAWRQPELHSLMAFLLVKSRRYDEARLAYDELIEHYRPIYHDLTLAESANSADKLWPCFKLDFTEGSMVSNYDDMLEGVPNELLKEIVDLNKILKLKEGLQNSERHLRELELKAKQWQLKESKARLARMRISQQEQIKDYEDLLSLSQEKIRARAAELINQTLAEAEYKRAELAFLQMQDLKKQLDTVQNFQTKKIQSFEENLKENDKGGSL